MNVHSTPYFREGRLLKSGVTHSLHDKDWGLIFLTEVEMGRPPSIPRVILCIAKLWPVHQACWNQGICWHPSGCHSPHQAGHEVSTHHNPKMTPMHTVFPKKTRPANPIITQQQMQVSPANQHLSRHFAFLIWGRNSLSVFALKDLLPFSFPKPHPWGAPKPVPLSGSSSLLYRSARSLRSPTVFFCFVLFFL